MMASPSAGATTGSPSLTDRYVDAAIRRLPAHQRPDIELELRASIRDAVDDRVEAGADAEEAEREVITGLGDPARLAAGYADRPMQLIGPDVYLDYTRLLTALMVTVVPAVAALVGLLRSVDEASTTGWSVLGAVVGAAVTTAVHVFFWTTLAFAVIDRAPARRRAPARAWTPAALPEPPDRRSQFAELVAGTVAATLVTAFVLLSPYVSSETDAAGDPVPWLDPWLWDTGVVYVFLGLGALTLATAYAAYYVRWSVPLAVVGAVVELAGAALWIWLALGDHVLNPAFVTAAGWSPEAVRWITNGMVVLCALSILHVVAEGLRRAVRR